jgi:hypothetical protein
MYEIKISDDLWKTIFIYLATLSWPLIVLIIVCILRKPIAWLLVHLKSIKWGDKSLEFDDMLKVLSAEDNKFHYAILKPVPAEAEKVAPTSMLSKEEIEQSKQRAEARIKEDTEKVGYRRGKPYQLPNGKWAVAWELEISAKIGIKDSLK